MASFSNVENLEFCCDLFSVISLTQILFLYSRNLEYIFLKNICQMETFVDLQKSLINISNLDIFARHPFITTGGDHFLLAYLISSWRKLPCNLRFLQRD